MGMLLGALGLWMLAGTLFFVGFRALRLRFVLRRSLDDARFLGTGAHHGLPPRAYGMGYAKHKRTHRMRYRRSSSLPSSGV